MPPKQQFTRIDIIEASFEIVRKHGFQNLSARAIAKELNSSTRPIYDHLKSMKIIEEELVRKVMAYFVEYISRERTGDTWLDQAIGYVIFAGKEKHLFRLINDEKYIDLQKQFGKEHWKELGEQLRSDERFLNMPDKDKDNVRIIRWFTIHGLAFLLNSGWYDVNESGELVTDQYKVELQTMLDNVNQSLLKMFEDPKP